MDFREKRNWILRPTALHDELRISRVKQVKNTGEASGCFHWELLIHKFNQKCLIINKLKNQKAILCSGIFKEISWILKPNKS